MMISAAWIPGWMRCLENPDVQGVYGTKTINVGEVVKDNCTVLFLTSINADSV